ncbi:hypothetical protein ASD11_05890 [Aeromicrobium sp. Root495]|uniref:hypothetical protein n=1 Tax=Aeromicrobium sp. Root495 TaxID=1736550 RepID=UPI0006FDCC6F|nr:hypothetical protein [Aeromicrobium sp. Root495]KQY59126.1 hypothetical protein ASD11_05890 [Aeromicrobium sp. Root495]
MRLSPALGLAALLLLPLTGCGGGPRTTADLATDFKLVPYAGAVRVFETYGSQDDVDDTVQIDRTRPLMAVIIDCVGDDDEDDAVEVKIGNVLVSSKCADLKEATVGRVGAQDVKDGAKISVTASPGVTWSVAVDLYDSSESSTS